MLCLIELLQLLQISLSVRLNGCLAGASLCVGEAAGRRSERRPGLRPLPGEDGEESGLRRHAHQRRFSEPFSCFCETVNNGTVRLLILAEWFEGAEGRHQPAFFFSSQPFKGLNRVACFLSFLFIFFLFLKQGVLLSPHNYVT